MLKILKSHGVGYKKISDTRIRASGPSGPIFINLETENWQAPSGSWDHGQENLDMYIRTWKKLNKKKE